jgi:hypothetical protein
MAGYDSKNWKAFKKKTWRREERKERKREGEGTERDDKGEK